MNIRAWPLFLAPGGKRGLSPVILCGYSQLTATLSKCKNPTTTALRCACG